MKIRCYLLGILMGCVGLSAMANDIIPQRSSYYYQLGGGSDLSIPPVQTNTTLTIGGDTHASLGFSCGGFNPSVTVSNTLDDIKTSIEGMSESIIESATTAIGSLPMYMLQKSDPGMYNIVQNGISGGQDQFNLSVKSCQQAMNNISNGQNPYQNWFSVSDSQGWLKYAGDASSDNSKTDVSDASKTITKNGAGYYGIPWVHQDQNSGGTEVSSDEKSQLPIKVINDVVVAGYNVLVDPHRALDSNETPSSGQNDELKGYWSTPNEAGQWASTVLGDYTISGSNTSSNQSTVAGIGLTAVMSTCPKIGNYERTCITDIENNLWQLVQNSETPTTSQLEAVSASSLMVTPQVIDAIKNQNQEQQSITVSKLAQEVAIQNVMDEAMLLRRMLLAGEQTRPVANLGAAVKMVDAAEAQLDKDIQNLLFEHNVRKAMLTNSLQVVLSAQNGKEAKAINETKQGQALPMRHGATYLDSRAQE